MSEFLFELRFLELPPWRARRLIESFGRRLFEELTSRGLVPGAMVSGGSVRRLTFRFSDLPEQEPERTEERIGPAVADAWDDDGEPTEALRAFAAEHEVDPSAVERLHTLRGDHAGLLHARPGRRLREVLIDLLPALAAEVVGAGDRVAFGVSQWPRPLNGVLAALDGELLPIVLDSCAAELASAGHWIHSPDTFPVADADSWSRELAARGLITGWAARRQAIQSALQQAAEPFGTLRDDADLLEDSTARCEQPFVVVGRFEPSFLELPAELVAAALAGRHGAFAVVGADGDLAPVFLAVVDWPGSVPDTVVGGLERSARGHLEDLRFHVESDRTQALAERLRRLEDLVFHPLLGSSADQARRREALAREVCAELDWQEEVEAAAEAALLLDVDRTTAVVEQFPSLRGVVGGLYARAEGYGESIWQAMYDSAGSVAAASPPRGRAGRAVAVADRLVGLVGLIGVGQASAGTRTPMSPPRRREIGPGPAPKAGAPDPAGLADDLLGLLLETGMEVDLDLLAARSVLLYGDRLERPA
ncbi:MAG: glycine--tRNA ligase subunit beta, partial [Acidobacteriota bacterium]